jgi:hypothetical protein
MTQKTLAKSLHTVTALVQVARYYKASNDGVTLEYAVFAAIAILGYGIEKDQDPYCLADKAIAILNKTR